MFRAKCESCVGLGTARLDPGEADAVITTFVELGGRLVDLALVYPAISAVADVVNRFSASSGEPAVRFFVTGCHPPRCGPSEVQGEIDRARRLLRTEFLDGFVLHRDDPSVDARRFLDVLVDALQSGAIHSYGLSNWSIERVDELCRRARDAGCPAPTVLGNHFSLLPFERPPWPGTQQVSSREVLWLDAEGITLHAWSPLASGLLCGPRKPSSWSTRAADAIRQWLDLRARELGVSTSTLVLGALMSTAPNVTPIVGARSTDHIRDALAAADYVGDASVGVWDVADRFLAT